MINLKYYQDIKNFPFQFKKGLELAKNVSVECEGSNFNQIVLCGMGGSSWPANLINDFLEANRCKVRIKVNRSYVLPSNVTKNTLFLVASYSGNTEETLSCLEDIKQKEFKYIAFTSGGKLFDEANKKVVFP